MTYNEEMGVKKGNQDQLIIMAYVSNINAAFMNNPVSLNQMTTQVLGQANKNNQFNAITGVLYCGNGHFFQCLEGKQSDVVAMYEKIKRDQRHDHVNLLLSATINQRFFDSWSMKFINSHQEISSFFNQHEIPNFEPEKLDNSQLKSFIKLLTRT